jgi:hypothetical protein
MFKFLASDWMRHFHKITLRYFSVRFESALLNLVWAPHPTLLHKNPRLDAGIRMYIPRSMCFIMILILLCSMLGCIFFDIITSRSRRMSVPSESEPAE